MKSNKDSSIRVRIDRDVEAKLKQLCEWDNTTPSAVVRKLVDVYVARHSLSDVVLDVLFEITTLPESNPHSWYMFEIEAELKGELEGESLESIELPFLLPEFFEGEREPFRVDSAYYHRMSFPNCIGKRDRFLGAKVVNRKWKGAIYVYRDELLDTPDVYETQVQDALKENIILGVSQYVKLKMSAALESDIVDEVFNLTPGNERDEQT
ncbi:hypothetical protein [Vibrio lentus]|uniref:hypothetical protein n=1 Tax=Vibrio lentus TaxID=136468 RepID=UPI000C836DD9|nr:hypothetical protein [Vibrio lentus]PMM56712.1 hypothetical protein BCT51_08010 [Vibrio lentus]